MGKTSFTISPARSGKSTFWNQWLKESDPDGLNRVVLCRDVFRLAYYGERFNASKEDAMHERFDIAWKALHSTGQYHIGLDETNTTIKAIRNVLRVDIDAVPIFINTPIDVCEQRAMDTDQLDLVYHNVISRMFDNLITLCNYGVAKCAMLPPERYDLIKGDYIYAAVEKIRSEERNNCLQQ